MPHRQRCDLEPGRFESGWPDPLVPGSPLALEADHTVAVWITVDVPRNAPPGLYTGSVRLRSSGAVLAEHPFTVQVCAFELLRPPAGCDTSAGDQAMARAAALAPIPNAGGLRSTETLPDPAELYRTRDAATAIETLLAEPCLDPGPPRRPSGRH